MVAPPGRDASERVASSAPVPHKDRARRLADVRDARLESKTHKSNQRIAYRRGDRAEANDWPGRPHGTECARRGGCDAVARGRPVIGRVTSRDARRDHHPADVQSGIARDLAGWREARFRCLLGWPAETVGSFAGDRLSTTAPGTDGASFPFWSPDSRSIAFFANGNLNRVDIDGSSLRTLASAPVGAGGTWNREGVILYTWFRTRRSAVYPPTGESRLSCPVRSRARRDTDSRSSYLTAATSCITWRSRQSRRVRRNCGRPRETTVV